MTETPSQLTQLVEHLYHEMEQGLIQAWQDKLQNPEFLAEISKSLSLKDEVQTICQDILRTESPKEELQSIVQIITLMQEQVERNSNKLGESTPGIKQYQELVQSLNKKVDNLEKEVLQYRIEASETRLASMDKYEELQMQVDQLKR
jgi:soluble cytochrome b562